jgi:hypothetical protein
MKNSLHALLLVSALLSPAAFAAGVPSVIDLQVEGRQFLGNEYIKTLDANENISFKFHDNRPHYVEQLMISAEGAQRNFSFAKVYADGDEVATLGVPGRDPDYPVIIRGDVSEIVLKVQDRSRVKLLGFKIYTDRKVYSSYQGLSRTQRRSMDVDGWGNSVLDLVHEFTILSAGTPFGYDVFSRFLKPLKIAAMRVQASDNARDARSLSTKEKAVILVDAIEDSSTLFESDIMLMDVRYDRLALDLMTIKQDIIEKYDLNRQ